MLLKRESIIETVDVLEEFGYRDSSVWWKNNAWWVITLIVIVAIAVILGLCILIATLLQNRKDRLSQTEHEVVCYGKSYHVLHGNHIDPETPVRKGYVFIGWYKDKECEIPWYEDDVVKHNMMLYPLWEKEGD